MSTIPCMEIWWKNEARFTQDYNLKMTAKYIIIVVINKLNLFTLSKNKVFRKILNECERLRYLHNKTLKIVAALVALESISETAIYTSIKCQVIITSPLTW